MTKRVIILAGLWICLAWFIESCMDAFMFNSGSFRDALLFDLAPHEIYVRLVYALAIVIGALLIARDYRRNKQMSDKINAAEGGMRFTSRFPKSASALAGRDWSWLALSKCAWQMRRFFLAVGGRLDKMRCSSTIYCVTCGSEEPQAISV